MGVGAVRHAPVVGRESEGGRERDPVERGSNCEGERDIPIYREIEDMGPWIHALPQRQSQDATWAHAWTTCRLL